MIPHVALVSGLWMLLKQVWIILLVLHLREGNLLLCFSCCFLRVPG